MRNWPGALVGLLLLTSFSFCLAASDTRRPAADVAATTYPNKPVRWVVPIAPGGSNDMIARLLAQKLTESVGQQFVVDNRPGASGSIGAETVAKATPDGYTLLFGNNGPLIYNVVLRKSSPYQFSDFEPVIHVGYVSLIIVAHPKVSARDTKELVALAKASSEPIVWGSVGYGSTLHIGLALLQAATGIQVVHVPYKGAAFALTDLIGGRINVMHTTAIAGEAHIKAGRIKVLGIAGPQREQMLPQVATLTEQGIRNADLLVWYGVVAPAKTAASNIGKLNHEINKVLQIPEVKERLNAAGVVIVGGPPVELTRAMKSEAERLATLIKDGRLTLSD